MILDRWKTSEVSPTSAQVHCLQSFQAAAAQGRRVEVEPDRLSELGRRHSKYRDTKATRVLKTGNPGERAAQRENPRDLGGLLVIPSSALSMYVKTRSETKDRAILKSNREQCPALTQHRMETVPTT